MRMVAMEPRPFRKTGPLLTASIKQPLKEPRGRCTLRTVLQLMARRANTVTARQWLKPQTATNMRLQTATPTRTPGVGGRTPTAAPQNPALQAGEARRKAAGHRPSAAVAEGGGRGRRVLVVRPAGAAVVAGAAAAVATAGDFYKCRI